MEIKFQDLNTGDVIYEKVLLPSQEEFWLAEEEAVLFSGGYGCGKSMILIMKTIYDAMSKDDNYILFGRKTYGEIHDILLKDFFEICHPSWIYSYKKTPHPSVVLNTFNGKTSEIIFRNLDKFSDTDIAGLNLGGLSIDQAEDTPESIYSALKGRCRRFNREYHTKRGLKWDEETKIGEVVARKYLSANPTLSWLFRVFKQENNPNNKIIEASTLENEVNLPKSYIDDLKTYPPLLYKQFVLGIWDESMFSENAVYAPEFLEQLSKGKKEPRQVREGLNIFEKHSAHKDCRIQAGIDCAEGADTIDEKFKMDKKDNAVVTFVCMDCEMELATMAARLTPTATADKFMVYAKWYGNPLVVPEMNSMGAALLNRLQDVGYDNIYRRHEFDRTLNRRTKKLGFRTTGATKSILIQRFGDRLRLGAAKKRLFPKVFSTQTIAELKTFVYSDIAGKKGAGAMEGYHDDRVMALLLAFYEDKEVVEGYTSSKRHVKISNIVETVPTLEMTKDGKFKLPDPFRQEKVAKWTV